jgi:hypothetical protein
VDALTEPPLAPPVGRVSFPPAAAREAPVAMALRAALAPLLSALAGQPPRPIRLMRGVGLDKSLASRLVQAVRADSDAQFLHLLPSPTGLRILIDRSQGAPEAAAWLPALGQAVDDFAALLDALPGGRQALDARLGKDSSAIRERREHMARQASFKAVSFLFGHYCETLSTSLFLVPSADGLHVDMVEVHRRLGLSRITPGTPLPLLSLHTPPLSDDGSTPAARVTPVDGNPATDGSQAMVGGAADVHRYFVTEASSLPLPELEIEREGSMSTFLLGPNSPEPLPARLTTAVRVARVELLRPDEPYVLLRNYMLHTPCQRLVREIFLAEGVWPDALPQIGFYLPGPSGAPVATPPPGVPHYRRLSLSAPIEQLPPGDAEFELSGVPDHGIAIRAVLQRAGLAGVNFRGWRCQTPYPVPLVEMQVGFRFAAHGQGPA